MNRYSHTRVLFLSLALTCTSPITQYQAGAHIYGQDNFTSVLKQVAEEAARESATRAAEGRKKIKVV